LQQSQQQHQQQQQQQQHQHHQQQQQQRSATPEQSHSYQIGAASSSPEQVGTTVQTATRVPVSAGHVATAPAASTQLEHSHDQYRQCASSSPLVSLARNDHFAEWCVAVANSVEVQLGGDGSRRWS
jgi:transcription initiation factor TFIID subunit TAF12